MDASRSPRGASRRPRVTDIVTITGIAVGGDGVGKLQLEDPEIVEALDEWRYGSKISMAAKGGEGAARAVGLHPYDRPNFVFPLADCHLTDFRLMALWRELRGRLALLPQPLTRLP